jgi:magnesium transporter
VGQALENLRREPPAERIIYFYVVDREGQLQGVVPTRRLLLAGPEKPVTEVMVRKVVTLPATATVLEACEFFIQHRFLAFPVVDKEQKLLGVVDVELYTDEIGHLSDAAQRDDLFQLIGVHVAGARQTAPLAAFLSRFPWLGCNLAAGILAAFVSGMFDDLLARVVALALFIPVVLNLAESVSSQSVSLTLHLLQGRAPTWKALPDQIRRELTTGLLLGTAAGLVVGLVALVWLGHWRVALVLWGGIAGGVTFSALIGLIMPLLLRLLRLDPRVAAGPVALGSADVITILLYLYLARWLLG